MPTGSHKQESGVGGVQQMDRSTLGTRAGNLDPKKSWAGLVTRLCTVTQVPHTCSVLGCHCLHASNTF